VEALAAASTDRSQRVEEQVRAQLPRGEHERFARLLEWARYWGQALNDRHELAAGALWERELIWQAGRRACGEGLLADPADVLLLARADLDDFTRSNDTRQLRQVLETRRRAYLRHKRLTPPKWIGKPPAAVTTGSANESASHPESIATYAGQGFGGGKVTGRARIVTRLDPGLLDSLTPEDVFILPHEQAFFRNDWHSLMTIIKGVVSPGQPSHHLAQVARECGVPLIGHVTGDLSRIAEGATVHVDGTLGIMHVQPAPAPPAR
jgi:pyruvate,water dikinase